MSADPNVEPSVRTAQPAARLVTERHLLKVLGFLRDRGRTVPANPELPLWVGRDDLAELDVLPPESMAGTEPRLLLLTNPDDRMLADLPRECQLREYWRLLFRAAVSDAVERKTAAGKLTSQVCAERYGLLGPAAAREIEYVLRADHLIDPEANPADRYAAFAATYLDLDQFAPAAVEEVFPSLPDRETVRRVLAEDVDAAGLFAASTPPGAADPEREQSPDEAWVAPAGRAPTPSAVHQPGSGSLSSEAAAAEQRGNFVRGAILHTRGGAAAAARVALGELVGTLAAVLDWDDDTRGEWVQALSPLLALAADGAWPRAARCLYDLQKIPADVTREVYAVDLVEPIRTLGRRPVKRPLPHARNVIVLMRLKSAHRQLLRSGVGEFARLRLDGLLHHEIHRAEHAVRHAQRPVIAAALDAAGFHPSNRVEEVARAKVVEELLDRVCDHGRLRIGDLRDAVARNQLKMPDLAGPGEFLGGDALLRADTRLAYDLDGVYRRGELYLRWLQRASSLFFGTPIGRAVFLYLVLPFLGGFMSVVSVMEITHLAEKGYAFASKILAPPPPPHPVTADQVTVDEETGEFIWVDTEEAWRLAQSAAGSSAAHGGEFHVPWVPVGVLSVFFLLLLHVPPFRRLVADGLAALGRGLRLVLFELPREVWHAPAFRRFRQSRPVRFVNRYFGLAILVTIAVVGLMAFLGATPVRILRWAGIVFGVTVLVGNTRFGWVAQERFAESLADWWRVVRVNMLLGLIRAIIDLFARLANWFERQLYAVDEWLRFRGGDSGGSLATKAVLGLVWFPFAYVARFVFYLLFEPQVNPVKHFPVVTVSHKVLLPLALSRNPAAEPSTVGAILVNQFGLGVGRANFLAFWGIFCVPGVFGFIAWELMSNWKLYRANRPPRLRPVTIGSHGESMRGLLRPGFHSGTVPRLFRKLRRASRTSDRNAVGRYRHELDHAAEGVRRFVERDLVPLLEGEPAWGGVVVRVGAVRFGCQRAAVELEAPTLGRDPLVVTFENRDGRIEAGVERAGWFDKLTEAQRAAVVAAARGLLDMAAAELYDGTERTPEANGPAIPDPVRAELARPFIWNEWVARWERKG